MKNIKTFLVLFILISCALKPEAQTKFSQKIKEIYSQHWVAGVQGGGSGTNVFIQFVKPLPKNMQLQKIFFQDKETTILKTNDSTFLANFSVKGKRISDLQETDENLPGNKTQNELKPKYNLQPNQAIVEYLLNGKKKRFKISNIKEKEMLAYPSARPRN